MSQSIYPFLFVTTLLILLWQLHRADENLFWWVFSGKVPDHINIMFSHCTTPFSIGGWSMVGITANLWGLTGGNGGQSLSSITCENSLSREPRAAHSAENEIYSVKTESEGRWAPPLLPLWAWITKFSFHVSLQYRADVGKNRADGIYCDSWCWWFDFFH